MSSHTTLTLPFSKRAELPNTPPLTAYLLSLISIKQSNLCVSADVHTTYDLLTVAEEVGDYICVLKTHADIIDDWSGKTIRGLQEISSRKHFLLFEDRKLGDIGNTVQSQYTRGPLAIATWAHLTNAHLLPGPSIISSLHTAATETLLSLNQSVSTTITSDGVPRTSFDSATSTDGPSIAPTTTSAPNLSPSPSSPSPERSEPQTLLTHHRRQGRAGSLTTATTTITQTTEPTSPHHPASLIHALSIGEASSSSDKAKALSELGPPPHARGLLLLAEMSSAGNLVTGEYTEECVRAARAERGFVVGFVSQRSLNGEEGDAFLSFAPGVGLPEEEEGEGKVEGERKGDGKGQVWRGPEEVVGRDGVDVCIVGRGILGKLERGREAERYRRAAWEAYERRVGRK